MPNPLGDLISRGEGGYNSYNRGTSNGHMLPATHAIDFGEMTLDELRRRQSLPKNDPDRIFAVGKYQLIPKTLADAMKDLHLKGSARFSPELQEHIFAEALIVRKRYQVSDYIKGVPGATLYDAQKAISEEWASVDAPDTPGRPYGSYGKSGNHSTIRAHEVAIALDTMRETFQTNFRLGASKEDAWRLTTNQNGLLQHEHLAQAPEQRISTTKHHIENLQQTLSHLGYRNHDGTALAVDGILGRHTRTAIERFQLEHGLKADGIAGQDTWEVLHATQANPFLNRYHPHHALYEQALRALHAEEARRGIASGEHSERLAGALTVAAVRDGLIRIDRVELNTPGSLARAVQVSPIRDEPGLNRDSQPVTINEALRPSLHHSSQQVQQMTAESVLHRHEPSQHARVHEAPIVHARSR